MSRPGVQLPAVVEAAIATAIPAGIRAVEQALPGAVAHIILETHRDALVEALVGWVRGVCADFLALPVHVQASPEAEVTIERVP